VDRRKHWWNPGSALIDQCDVVLYEDGGRWWVEIRMGVADSQRDASRSRRYWREFADEEAAMDRVHALLSGPQSWQQMP
jgi:hypothetical protein